MKAMTSSFVTLQRKFLSNTEKRFDDRVKKEFYSLSCQSLHRRNVYTKKSANVIAILV